jgi:hypothetical protein
MTESATVSLADRKFQTKVKIVDENDQTKLVNFTSCKQQMLAVHLQMYKAKNGMKPPENTQTIKQE